MYKLDIIEAKMKQGQDVSQDAREYDNMFKNLYEYARLHAEREQVQQQVQQQLLMQFILSGANNPVPIPNINMPQQRQPVCRTVNYSGKMVTQCE
jgi:hypothetical protein